MTERMLLGAIRAYQRYVSPLTAPRCKYYPTCSEYAAEAVRVHGARRGTLLAARRLARCHPFHRGGVDLVPSPSRRPADDGSCRPAAAQPTGAQR